MGEVGRKLQADAAMCADAPPCTSIHINRAGAAVEVMLDTKADYYGEWIRGEGADICLYRDRESGRVVGARLPLKYERVVFSDEQSEDQV